MMTSHDVRRLKTCTICNGIGIHAPKDSLINVALVVAVPSGYAHPKCYVRKHGIGALLSLEDSELRRIRLCDVSYGILEAILRRKEK